MIIYFKIAKVRIVLNLVFHNALKFHLKVQLSPEKYGFELHESTHTCVFSINIQLALLQAFHISGFNQLRTIRSCLNPQMMYL